MVLADRKDMAHCLDVPVVEGIEYHRVSRLYIKVGCYIDVIHYKNANNSFSYTFKLSNPPHRNVRVISYPYTCKYLRKQLSAS